MNRGNANLIIVSIDSTLILVQISSDKEKRREEILLGKSLVAKDKEMLVFMECRKKPQN